MDRLHLRNLLAKPFATVTVTLGSATSVFTCLGRLGLFDGQGKYIQCDIAGIIARNIMLNIANVNLALDKWIGSKGFSDLIATQMSN